LKALQHQAQQNTVEPTHKKMDYFIHSAAASSICDL